MNKKEDLDSFKIEQTHFVSSLNKTLESLEELSLSLSQVKDLIEKSKKVKVAMKIKVFSLTDASGSDSSGEGEMIAQLKEKFYITGKKNEKFLILTVLPKSWSIRKI
jgi:hypothetical protein